MAQPAENAGKRFRPLAKGPLRLWDSTTSATRELAITAAGERPSWFPDGRRLAYTAPAAISPGGEAVEPMVHLLDTSTGESTPLAPGRLPIVSSDGRSVLLARGKSFDLMLIDAATRAEQTIPRMHGLGTPIALIDGRYLIYKGHTTPGAAKGTTTNNSPFVGPKPMMAIKLLDIQTREFMTLVPLVDPRCSVTALAHAAPGAK